MTSPSNHDRNLPPDPTDLRIRRLQQRLRAAETLCDLAWDEGYAAAERTLHVPDELITALRHGSAHEHAHIPIAGQLVAIVLARSGTGHPCPAEEKRVWEDLQQIYWDATEAAPTMDCMLRWELPAAIGAMTWRAHGHVIVVRGSAWHRRCLKRALHCHRGAWALLPLAGAAVGKTIGRVVHTAPVAMMAAAVSVTAVTAIGTAPWQGDDVTLRRDHQVRQVVSDVPASSSSPTCRPKKTPTPTPTLPSGATDRGQAPPTPAPSLSAAPEVLATPTPLQSSTDTPSSTPAALPSPDLPSPALSHPVSRRGGSGRSRGRAPVRHVVKRTRAVVQGVAGIG